MDSLQIETRRNRAEQRLIVRGELDLASTPELERRLAAALTGPQPAVVVDVTRVRFADCTAVGLLLRMRRQAESASGSLRVAGASGVVLQLLEIAGVAKQLGVYDFSDDTPEPALPEPAAEPDPPAPADEALVNSMLDTMSQLQQEVSERQRIRERVVTTCTPFAISLARRFAQRGEPLDDLRQVALIGLLKAVDGYDPERGREFTAYAKPTILGELRRHFRDRTWAVNVPRRHKELRLALNAAGDELTQRLGRSPSVAELAEHLGVGVAEVLQALEAAQAYQPMSLSTPVGDRDGSGATLAELVGDSDRELTAVEDRATVPAIISTLPEREQRILTMRFYHDMTQSQIASRTGVSQMHVSRLIKASLARLRRELPDGS